MSGFVKSSSADVNILFAASIGDISAIVTLNSVTSTGFSLTASDPITLKIGSEGPGSGVNVAFAEGETKTYSLDVSVGPVYTATTANGTVISAFMVNALGGAAPAPAPAPAPASIPAGILINIPIEIDAGNFATALTVQGESVSYNHVHLPLEYQTAPVDPTAVNMANTFRWREDQVDQTQVEVESNAAAIGSYANGKAVVKALFKASLEGADLRNVAMAQGVVYADDSARTTVSDPVKFYESKDIHTVGNAVGSTLKAYLQEYLYDNLSKAIGLAATTGVIDITLSRSGAAASEIVAEALSEQLCGVGNTEQGVAALALRQNIYEQMFTLAPERFVESDLMRRDPAADSQFKNLPFQIGDTMAFLVTFRFPASQISAPVVESAIRVANNANVYVDTGSKIQVIAPADSTATTRPQLSDFPNCTVMLRTKLLA